jgi:nitrile hydratase subunit beta
MPEMSVPRGVHDRGGWPDDRPIDRSEHDPALWEQRTDAMMRLLSSPERRVIRVDELRRAIESIPPGEYEAMGYYQRWLTAIEALMVEKGILTTEEIDRKAAELATQAELMPPPP